MVEERLPEPGRVPGIPPEVDEELPEALAREVALADRPSPVLLPEDVVDPPVGGEGPGRAREAEAGEGGAEGRALGPVEVEQGMVDVEEDGAETAQAGLGKGGATWRGR